MSSKKMLILGLAIVLAVMALGMVACGGGDDGKKDMQAALDVIEADIETLTTSMMSGGTVADLKAKKDELAPHWQAVIDACEKVEGADAVKAQKLWDDLSTAIDGVPDTAGLMELAAAVMGPVTALQTYEAELRKMVGESESK